MPNKESIAKESTTCVANFRNLLFRLLVSHLRVLLVCYKKPRATKQPHLKKLVARFQTRTDGKRTFEIAEFGFWDLRIELLHFQSKSSVRTIFFSDLP